MLEPEIRILKGRRRKGEIISMQAFRPNDQFINSIKNIIELVHLCKLCASFKKSLLETVHRMLTTVKLYRDNTTGQRILSKKWRLNFGYHTK